MTTTTAPTGPTRTAADLPEHVDVAVVGAGLSGVGMACRLREISPKSSVVVLEARESMGGTWDLFRYPGVRSDSDMYTLSFPFRPWTGEKSIADGEDIRSYILDTAREHGVTERVHTGCRVTAGSWSTPEQRWTLTITDPSGTERQLTAGYVHLASGYYRYEGGYEPDFPGREDFAGTVIHPQHWPEDLDLTGRRVVIIGSGATAVTLVPALARQAEHVTMLQRTPGYVFAVPSRDKLAPKLRAVLPDKLAHHLTRGKHIAQSLFLYQLSRKRPEAARSMVMGAMSDKLPQEMIDEHFTPSYGVWDQRLCAVPSGDLFRALRTDAADVVTGHIDRWVPEGIRLTDGRLVEADVIVTATGLVLQAAGGMEIAVDGQPVDLATSYAYRGIALSGVPNASMTIGYINSSWTLRADLVSKYIARLVEHMRTKGLGIAVPVAPEGMTAGPILDISAGYVQRAVSAFPKLGDRVPWTLPQNYLKEMAIFARADLTQDMAFFPVGAKGVTLPTSAPAPALLDLPGSSSTLPEQESPALPDGVLDPEQVVDADSSAHDLAGVAR